MQRFFYQLDRLTIYYFYLAILPSNVIASLLLHQQGFLLRNHLSKLSPPDLGGIVEPLYIISCFLNPIIRFCHSKMAFFFCTLLACGGWKSADQRFFCGSKNLCRRTHRSVSTDRLCTLSGVLGADLFAEIFSLKTEKFLLAKVGKLEKIFAVRKFLTG